MHLVDLVLAEQDDGAGRVQASASGPSSHLVQDEKAFVIQDDISYIIGA